MTAAVDPMPVAQPYDDALRWKVSSRTDPHAEYVVELGSYNCNGECPCDDFQIRFRPLLARGLTPAQALRRGLVKQRDYQLTEDDVLKCWHIVEGYRRFGMQCARAFAKAKRAHPTGPGNQF